MIPGIHPVLPLPSQERLRELFDYDPETGIMKNRIYRGGRSRAGDVLKPPCVGLDGRKYVMARIIYKYMTNQEPPDLVDHEDGDVFNTKWINIRAATPSQNSANRKMDPRNKTGHRGVFRCKNGRYIAVVKKERRVAHLSLHDDLETAAAAARAAFVEHFGVFANQEPRA